MKDEFIIERQGKQYVLFAGLLDEAHSRGLTTIDTELLQVPDAANGDVAVIKATVEMEDGRIFSGIGDASPSNVGRNIAPHIIRMAETRAKARALRDAVNVSAMAFEELSELTERTGVQKPDVPNAPDSPNGSNPTPIAEAPSRSSSSTMRKANKSQVDMLETLVAEARGEDGVRKMEAHIGKKLSELTSREANAWIDRFSPASEDQG